MVKVCEIFLKCSNKHSVVFFSLINYNMNETQKKNKLKIEILLLKSIKNKD